MLTNIRLVKLLLINIPYQTAYDNASTLYGLKLLGHSIYTHKVTVCYAQKQKA
jgi:hypothetical protein